MQDGNERENEREKIKVDGNELYAIGNIQLLQNTSPYTRVAIVGSRDSSVEGDKVASMIAEMLVNRGYTVVTGLARGIDTAVALKVLSCRGNLIGVVPWITHSSVPKFYSCNDNDNNICIVSPFYHYIEGPSISIKYYLRNRIIYKLSSKIILIEARDNGRSGTMHYLELISADRRRGLTTNNKEIYIWKPIRDEEEYIRAYNTYVSKGAIPFASVSDIHSHIPYIDDGSSLQSLR